MFRSRTNSTELAIIIGLVSLAAIFSGDLPLPPSIHFPDNVEWHSVSDDAPILTRNRPPIEIMANLPETAFLKRGRDSESKQFGLVTKDGEWAVKPVYQSTYEADEGLAWLMVEEKWGLVTTKGEWLIDPVFDYVKPFDNGVAQVRLTRKDNIFGSIELWGVIDRKGKWVFEPQFNEIGEFSENKAVVNLFVKIGYIDASGKLDQSIIPQFSRAQKFTEGLAAVGGGGGIVRPHKMKYWGYIDQTGKLVIKNQYHDAMPFESGYAAVEKNGKWGYIDKQGNWLLTPQFSSNYPFKNGLAGVSVGDKWGYMNTQGKIVIPAIFDEIHSFNEYGIAPVQIADKYQYIDRSGRFLSELHFDKVRSFSEGLAAVKIGRNWGYINRAAKIVIEPQFAEAGDFDHGTAAVWFLENSDLKGFINPAGKIIFGPPIALKQNIHFIATGQTRSHGTK